MIGGELRRQDGVGPVCGEREQQESDDECHHGREGGKAPRREDRWRRGPRVFACQRLAAGAKAWRQWNVHQTRRVLPNHRPCSALVRGGGAARRTRVQMPLDISLLARRELVVDIRTEAFGRAPTVVVHHRVRRPSAPAWPRDRLSRSYSSRRPREILDITVPIGMPTMPAISAYVNSSTSRSHTASRNASGSVSSAACRSSRTVARSRICSGVSSAAGPSPPDTACSTRGLSISTASRAASRRRFRHVFSRIVYSHAFRFVPGLKRSENRSAFTNVSCTRSSASAAFRSEEHTSELQSLAYLVCRLLLEKKKKKQ